MYVVEKLFKEVIMIQRLDPKIAFSTYLIVNRLIVYFLLSNVVTLCFFIIVIFFFIIIILSNSL